MQVPTQSHLQCINSLENALCWTDKSKANISVLLSLKSPVYSLWQMIPLYSETSIFWILCTNLTLYKNQQHSNAHFTNSELEAQTWCVFHKDCPRIKSWHWFMEGLEHIIKRQINKQNKESKGFNILNIPIYIQLIYSFGVHEVHTHCTECAHSQGSETPRVYATEQPFWSSQSSRGAWHTSKSIARWQMQLNMEPQWKRGATWLRLVGKTVFKRVSHLKI